MYLITTRYHLLWYISVYFMIHVSGLNYFSLVKYIDMSSKLQTHNNVHVLCTSITGMFIVVYHRYNYSIQLFILLGMFVIF